MRVGVVTPQQPPTVGGGFAFHKTLLETLEHASTTHEFVLLDIGGTGFAAEAQSRFSCVNLRTLFRPEGGAGEGTPITELAAHALGLDVVWYPHPPAEVLSVPIFVTVLDLAHRQHPFFPEVSTEDWEWNPRENHYRRVLPRAARIFTGTQSGKNEIVRCYGVNPANVIVNPFPAPLSAPIGETLGERDVLDKYGLTSDYFFYPAQIWPHKNHVSLLLALKQLQTVHNLSAHLVLTGADKGNLEYLHQVIKNLGLQQRVHVLGFVPRDDIAWLYRKASALVFPSLFGPDNLPPLEAFSLDCPVLAGYIDGVEEQLGRHPDSVRPLRHRVNGWIERQFGSHLRSGPEGSRRIFAGYFDPTDPEDMAAAMARVLRDRGLREDLIEHGRLLAAERTPEAYVQIVLKTLDEFEPWRRTWPREPGQIASEVSLPRASEANEVLSQVGIFEDGWLAACSSLLLSAPGDASRLTVRGEVPFFGGDDFSTALSVSIDGIPMARSQLFAGTFDVTLEPVGRPGLHRIDLTFSEAQKLPEPDVREVGAKLYFIGFV